MRKGWVALVLGPALALGQSMVPPLLPIQSLPIRLDKPASHMPTISTLADPLDVLQDDIETLVDTVSKHHPEDLLYVSESYTGMQVGILNPKVDPKHDEIVVLITGYNASTPDYIDEPFVNRSYQSSKRPIYFIDPNIDPKPPAETAYNLGHVLEKIVEASGAKRCVVVCYSKAGVDFRALVTNKANSHHRTYDYSASPLFEKIIGVGFLAVPHHGIKLLEVMDRFKHDTDDESETDELDGPRTYLSNAAIDQLFSKDDPYPSHLYMLNVIGTRPYSPLEMDELLPLPPKRDGTSRSWRNLLWQKLASHFGFFDSDGLVRVSEARLDIADRETRVWLQHDKMFTQASPVMAYIEELFVRKGLPSAPGTYISRKPKK